MSHADAVPPEFLRKVAGELKDAIGKHLPKTPVKENATFLLSSDAAPDHVEKASMQLHLCETFAVWRLKAGIVEALNSPEFGGDISYFVEATNFLYHQVREKGELVAFARSRVGDEESAMSLTQYNIGPLFSSVDRAIGMIERSEQYDKVAATDPVVRLLEIPSHHIIALWLYSEALKESRSVIVSAPKSISVENIGRLLTSAEFFALLKKIGLIRAIT
jgi:hypothetical protein